MQLSGPREDAMAYADWVKADERFSPTYIQVSPSPRGHAFPRLKLRYKPSLVQVRYFCNPGTFDISFLIMPRWEAFFSIRNSF